MLFQNLNIQYSVVHKSWSTSHYFIFCFQGARHSSNFLKWCLNIYRFPDFMKVFYCFSLHIVCFSIHFHSSPCVYHFQRFCLFFLRHLTLLIIQAQKLTRKASISRDKLMYIGQLSKEKHLNWHFVTSSHSQKHIICSRMFKQRYDKCQR